MQNLNPDQTYIHTLPCSTGVVTPLHRRQQIYAVCQKHDIIILEDDPYFYLQFSASSMAPRGLHNLGASYLSLDIDGRVIRLDSFSKVQLSSMCVLCQVLVQSILLQSLMIRVSLHSSTQHVALMQSSHHASCTHNHAVLHESSWYNRM